MALPEKVTKNEMFLLSFFDYYKSLAGKICVTSSEMKLVLEIKSPVRSYSELHNWSFDVVDRTRMTAKCAKMKRARAKRAKELFCTLNMQISDEP